MDKEEQEFLKNYSIEDFERPSIATDIAVFSIMDGDVDNNRRLPEKQLKLLLIKRASYPCKDAWALPGGFCRKNETVQETAARELYEETNVKDAYLSLAGIFSDAGRDPRGWIVSNAFMALIDGNRCRLRAGTDAWEARWFNVLLNRIEEKRKYDGDGAKLQATYGLALTSGDIRLTAKLKEETVYKNNHEKTACKLLSSDGLAFDHAGIIINLICRLRDRAEHDFRIIFDLMPEYFTLTELQKAFEIVMDKKLLAANFRRKLADYVLETDKAVEGNAHRPAKLFKRNVEAFYRG